MNLKKHLARRTFKLRKGYTPSSNQHQENMHEKALIKGENWDLASQKKARIYGVKRCRDKFNAIYDNTKNIKKGDVILLTMGKNENKRIPYFIKYYKEMGIDHLIFIDNNSDIPMQTVIKDDSMISLFHTDDCYVKSNFGVDWMNHFNQKYGVGHWVLTVDLDEFFVYPNMDERSYASFIHYLDLLGQKSVFTPLIDMYPNGSISSAEILSGESPLEKTNYYDGSGYKCYLGTHGEIYFKGGPRLHHFCYGNIDQAPTLNKNSLIKWQDNVLYLSSTHSVSPAHLNGLNPNEHEAVTGALLHFKFISEIKEKALYAIKNNNHYNGSAEYKTYLAELDANEKLSLMNEKSKKYENWKSLVESGLMKTGYWV